MPKRIALIAAAASLSIVGSAAASPPHRLTLARAEHAIRVAAAVDRPSSVTFTHCHRHSATQVGCWITEHNVMTLWTDNGQRIVGDLSFWESARLAKGHVLAR